MKKGFILLLLASSIGAQAQTSITITGADVAQIGKTMYMSYDTLVTTNPGAGGTNMVWNFSTLTPGYTDTVSFLSPAGTPWASMFPSSNVYITQSGSTGGAYLQKTASAVFLDGFADPTFAADYNPNEQIIALPTTYNTSFTNNSVVDYKDSTSFMPPADSFLYRSKKMKVSTADAWGTLTLPSGTFNVVRVKDVEYYTDSTYIHIPIFGWVGTSETLDTNWHYSWWANGQSFPILQVDSSSDGLGEYYYMSMNPTSVKGLNALAARTYPNPAKDVIHFSTASTKASISIYDAKGSLVRRVDNLKGEFDLQVSDLNNGMYMYTIAGDDDKTAKGTFHVMH
jgi:hypothetical protein